MVRQIANIMVMQVHANIINNKIMNHIEKSLENLRNKVTEALVDFVLLDCNQDTFSYKSDSFLRANMLDTINPENKVVVEYQGKLGAAYRIILISNDKTIVTEGNNLKKLLNNFNDLLNFKRI